jgi:hypothetical protein
MKRTVTQLNLRELTLDKETLCKLVLGGSAMPFTQRTCIVSQCANICTNLFDTCA